MLRKAGTMLAFPHVLLIDDNSVDRDYYAHRLKVSSPDCVVVQAATGLSGLALFKQHSPDCVVLELNLPDMSGFELLLKLVPHVSHPEIAVIILTRLDNPFLLQAAITNGAQAALHKSTASGDILDKTIMEAIAGVQKDRKREAWFFPTLRSTV